MKSYNFALVILIFLLGSCSKTDTSSNSLVILNLKGKVKSIETTRFTGKEKFGEFVKGDMIPLKVEYEGSFFEKIKASSFLSFYMNLERFQTVLATGAYESLNSFFDYSASFNEEGNITTLIIPDGYYYKNDSLVYKRLKDEVFLYNKVGEEISKMSFEEGRLVKIKNNEIKKSNGEKTFMSIVNREYKDGILRKISCQVDESDDFELLLTNKNNKLSYNNLNEDYDYFSFFEYDYAQNSLKLIPNKKNTYWGGVTGGREPFFRVVYNSNNRIDKIKMFLPEDNEGYKEIDGFNFRYNDNQDVLEISLNAYEDGILHEKYKKKVFKYEYDEYENWTRKIERHYKGENLKSIEVSYREIEYWN